MLKQEEIKWLQRYKNKEITDGDCNTRYYHAKVNGRRRKNKIVSLEQDEGVIEGEEQLMKYITDFYKNLFGQPDNSNIYLSDQNLPKISREDVEELTKNFILQEIHDVVFGMEKNKSLGPDGFPADFYQEFWDLVKWI